MRADLLTLYGHIKTAEQRPDTLFSITVIGTLAVDGWAVTFGTARRGLGGPHRCSLLNVTSTASVPTSYQSMWRYDCLSTLKG